MAQYNAIGEVDVAPTSKRAEQWMTALETYSPAVGRSARGTTEVIITVEASHLEVAALQGLKLLGDALGALSSFTVMTSEEFDRRVADPAVERPHVLGANAAAELLGVSRQRVQQLAADNAIPYMNVGKALAFLQSDLEIYLERQQAKAGA